MSEITFLRGGLLGLKVTGEEIDALYDALKQKLNLNDDLFIPLPNLTVDQQKDAFLGKHPHKDKVIYWATDSGSHGWCCSTCGLVTQWG